MGRRGVGPLEIHRLARQLVQERTHGTHIASVTEMIAAQAIDPYQHDVPESGFLRFLATGGEKEQKTDTRVREFSSAIHGAKTIPQGAPAGPPAVGAAAASGGADCGGCSIGR